MIDPSSTKRRNAHQTKARILEAAKIAFSEGGYAATGIRDIARRAAVAPSLIVQHFGSKAELFEASLFAAMADRNAVAGDRATFGVRMARLVSQETDLTLPGMVILSINDADARAITAKIVQDEMLTRLAEWLGPPDGMTRAMNVMMILTGFVIYARRLSFNAIDDKSVEWLARSLQAIVDIEDAEGPGDPPDRATSPATETLSAP